MVRGLLFKTVSVGGRAVADLTQCCRIMWAGMLQVQKRQGWGDLRGSVS